MTHRHQSFPASDCQVKVCHSETIRSRSCMEPSTLEEQALLALAGKLNEALESNDTKQFLMVLAQTIRERGGYTAAARAVGVNRTALYHTVSPDGNPRADTLSSLLTYFG